MQESVHQPQVAARPHIARRSPGVRPGPAAAGNDPAVQATAAGDAYNRLVAERLRWIRQERRMTLEAVELLSHGRYKPGVICAYERGDMPLTVETAAELAWLYGVTLGGLLEASPPSGAEIGRRLRSGSPDEQPA